MRARVGIDFEGSIDLGNTNISVCLHNVGPEWFVECVVGGRCCVSNEISRDKKNAIYFGAEKLNIVM